MNKANQISLAKALQLAYADGALEPDEYYTFEWRGEKHSVYLAKNRNPAAGTGDTRFLFVQKFTKEGMETVIEVGLYPVVTKTK